jgi:hypothetical protein
MLDEKRIVFYDNVSDGLITALHNHSTNSPKYAIIRVGTKCADIMKILSDNGWDFIEYDCDTTNKDAQTCEENKEIVKNMNNAPEKNTAILIKGFFRMGANIKKTHVSFMMETADSSKTDTLLQSLLGRACGYGDGSNSVYVYLSRSYEVSGEIIRYIEGIDECKRTGELCMHIQNARNLCGTYTKRETTPTIPFMIKDITINSDRDCSRGNESKNIQKQVIEKLKNGEYMLGKTHRAQADEIITQLLENGRTVQTHDMCKINEKTINQWKDLFNTKANRLLFDTQSEVPEDLHSTGMKVDKLVIGLFVYKNAVGNIPAGTVIIYGDTLCENPYFTNETLPDTTGCEVFAVGAIAKETMNGCVLHGLSRETSTNEKQMKKELTDIIKVYKAQSKKSSTELANCLKSYYDAETETYHEIILHKTVEKSMIKAGKIYKAIEKLGFTLVLVERNTYETNPDIVSYESISWIPINK